MKIPTKNKPYFENNRSVLFHGNCTDTDYFLNEFIDLTITSPPYNVGVKYNKYNDDLSIKEYLDFSKIWIKNCFNWTKDTGRLAINVPFEIRKNITFPIAPHLTMIAMEAGWGYYATIYWNKPSTANCIFGSFQSASCPMFASSLEVILIFYKKDKKKITGSCISDISKNDFINWTNSMWTFPGQSSVKIKHPAPYPVELPKRIMKLLSYENDIIFDPFNGSGTTLIAAENNNRAGIGMEIDKEYCELAKKRILRETDALDYVFNRG